jgi:hypothetical protein
MRFSRPPVVLLVLLLVPTVARPAVPVTIAVDAQRDIAPVPRRLFGTNLRQNMQADEAVRSFLKETGITLFRYPDSVDHGYTWDWTGGGVMTKPGKTLTSRLSRFDAALDLSKDAGAEIFFTTKIHGTTPSEAARWVAEAGKRGVGGSYWCLGNEPYFKDSPHHIPKEEYVDLVNRFAPAMRKADDGIKIGIAWGGPYIEEHADKGRDSFVIRGVGRHVDFIDFHFYTGRWEKKQGIDPKRILAGSRLVSIHMRKFREILRREVPDRADAIEIHYWEWNGPPWPAVGGIQTLATALHAADALGEMARNGVKAAIQYNLQEHACGLIPGWEAEGPHDWKTESWNRRTVRPLAYAIRLWSRAMGPTLVRTDVSGGGSYSTKDWHTLVNHQGEVPYLSAHATRSADRKSLQLMVINRHEKDVKEVGIALSGFVPRAESEVLVLNGPALTSHNDVADRKPAYHSFRDAPEPVVTLKRYAWQGASARFRYAFPAHAVTVIRMTSK